MREKKIETLKPANAKELANAITALFNVADGYNAVVMTRDGEQMTAVELWEQTLTDGSIVDPGVQPTTSTGVIGGKFTLFADCGLGSPCNPPPTANPQGARACRTICSRGEGLPIPRSDRRQ